MATIGSILVNFSAATAGYFAGSKSVKDDLGSFGSTFGGVGSALTGVFAGIGAALSAGALVEGLKSAGEEVLNLARDADKLSISTEALSRLRFAAKETGVDAESLSHAMLKLQETIGKAATEGGEAAQKITDLKLNLKQLASESPDQQFRDIAQAISQIQNPSERAAAEVALFGKSGAELKPLLEQGAAGLAAFDAKADKLHATISSVDAQTMIRAGRAVEDVETAVSGVAQHIAIELAPYVEDIANRFIAWATEGDRMGKIINGALTVVAYGAAFVVDLFLLLKSGAEIFGAVAVAAFGGLVQSIDYLGKAGSWVWEHVFGGKHIDTSGLDAAADDLAAKAISLYDAAKADATKVFDGSSAQKVFEYFQNIQDQAKKTSQDAVDAKNKMQGAFTVPDQSADQLKKITDIIADLHKQVDTFGMSEGAKKLYELKNAHANAAQTSEAQALVDQLDILKQQADVAKDLDTLRKEARQAGMDEGAKRVDDLREKGANAAQIQEAESLQAQIEATNKAKQESRELDEQAKKAREDALTPMQKEQQELMKLQKLYETGRISVQEFASAAAKKEADLHGESHNTQKAATRGTEEAFKLMNEINRRANGGDKKEQIAMQQLKAGEKANEYLSKLLARFQPKPPMDNRLGVA